MPVRHGRLVSPLRVIYFTTVVLCLLLLAVVRSEGGLRSLSSQGSKEISSQSSTEAAPTYYRDVQSILRQHCVLCHREGGIAPMSFEGYDAARRYAYLIRNVTQDKVMPPPFSVPLAGRVANDPSLTSAQISTLATWANLKAPAGDRPDGPPMPNTVPPWGIPKPDLIFKMPQPVSIPATGNVDYIYQIVPTRLTEGRWVRMAEVLPSLRPNLLQLMVVIRRPGSTWLQRAPAGKPFTIADLTSTKDGRWDDDDILMVYAPGSSTQEFSDTMGKFIPAGSDLIFRAQYVSNGSAGSDQSTVGLVFSDHPPPQRVITLNLGADSGFTIPANASDYRVEALAVLQRDVVLIGLFPLLNSRGKRFEFDAIPIGKDRGNHNPDTETLLRVNYDLRWQISYRLSEPRSLKAGTELRTIAWYDNSPNNPRNPNPNASVNWQPGDELLGGFVDVAVPATLGEHKLLVHRR